MRTAKSFNVIDSHTAGHPTRTVMSGIPALKGQSVREKRDYFKEHYDSLRGLLLHEPRGHVAMMAAVPVSSNVADAGLFFVSSYVYLDMCGHATIGYIATLEATGSLPLNFKAEGMSIETPAGVIHVHGRYDGDRLQAVVLKNVPCYVTAQNVVVDLPGLPTVNADVAYSGITYALVDAESIPLPFDVKHANQWTQVGMDIKENINAQSSAHNIGSVLFYKNIPGGGQHLVILARGKFDRSPCGTGTSARLAQLHKNGQLSADDKYVAENILGIPFSGVVTQVDNSVDGRDAVIPQIEGMAHVSAISTLLLDESDPLPNGFLPG